jgi:hypothetical protein
MARASAVLVRSPCESRRPAIGDRGHVEHLHRWSVRLRKSAGDALELAEVLDVFRAVSRGGGPIDRALAKREPRPLRIGHRIDAVNQDLSSSGSISVQHSQRRRLAGAVWSESPVTVRRRR